MDASGFNRVGEMTLSGVAWLLLGCPAVIAWAAVGLAWLLSPHLAVEPDFWAVAMWGALGWYGFLVLIFGGWFSLLLLTAF